MATTDDPGEKTGGSFLFKSLPLIISAISALGVTLLGHYFQQTIELEKQRLQQVELEIRKIDAAQKMLAELFSGSPERGFIADRLMAQLVDEKMSKEIHEIVKNYYSKQLEEKLSGESLNQARKIASAAKLFGGVAAEGVLQKQYYIVVASISLNEQEVAVSKAKALRDKGYDGEVYYSTSGWYVVTIGRFPFTEADSRRLEAINRGDKDIRADSYLALGHTFTKKLFP